MSHKTEYTRRKAVAAGACGLVGAIAGCASVTGDSGEESVDGPNPNPEIVEVVSEIGNFRNTDDRARTLILVKNTGRLGEFRLTIEALGESVALEEAEQIFSLDAGQEYQTRFDIFTHTGATDIRIFIEATNFPENFAETVINEQETPDKIDFSG
ncbi:hypothetical protein [Halohasta litorea]|uniref:Tat (Twin-arginine translocation) pathway signal sequence n=1 Tax=Halohasta litorea TaxID=869891 RepID=A0ABD6DAL4_9EURY|nr:hypothetical protein [Halohasta litorea]